MGTNKDKAMTEKAKQIIKNVPKLMSGTVVNFYDFTCIVEELCEEIEELKRWNKVEESLPEFNKVVNVKFISVRDEILKCSAQLQNIPRHNSKNPPMDKRWFVYPSIGHELTGKVTEWKPI